LAIQALHSLLERLTLSLAMNARLIHLRCGRSAGRRLGELALLPLYSHLLRQFDVPLPGASFLRDVRFRRDRHRRNRPGAERRVGIGDLAGDHALLNRGTAGRLAGCDVRINGPLWSGMPHWMAWRWSLLTLLDCFGFVGRWSGDSGLWPAVSDPHICCLEDAVPFGR
jgi:hypothetical protein